MAVEIKREEPKTPPKAVEVTINSSSEVGFLERNLRVFNWDGYLTTGSFSPTKYGSRWAIQPWCESKVIVVTSDELREFADALYELTDLDK